MKLHRVSSLVVAVLLVSLTTVSAHHSFAPVYDEKRTISAEGVVTQFKFANPHAMLFMDVTDASGKVVKWTVEFSGQLNLAQGGWTAGTIKPGEHVTVFGNPTHTGSSKMFFRRLVRADGTELLPPGAERLSAIEEERRQRALKRNEPK